MKLLLTLAAFIPFLALSQSDKKLLKILGDDFVRMEASKNYPEVPFGDVQFDTSTTFKGDTIGASFKGEFIMFKDSMSFFEDESFKLFKSDVVSNYEYDQFINWVIDSICREKIYINDNPTGNDAVWDEVIGEMLNHPKIYYDERNQQWMEFDPSQPAINRELFPFDYDFDWNKKINASQIIPLLDDFHLNPHERLSRGKYLDQRKYNYRIQGATGNGWQEPASLGFRSDQINISKDHSEWANLSEHPYDIYYNLAHYYGLWNTFFGYPVVGLTGSQAKAYLNWLEYKYQVMIDKKKLPYRIKLSLPTKEELEKNDCDCPDGFGMYTEERDMTEQWQITNEEYAEFLNWVEDSLVKEKIYADGHQSIASEDIANMLLYDDVYYDEVNLSWQEFDPANAFINRENWNFDPNFDYKKKFDSEIVRSITASLYDDQGFRKPLYIYRYYWMDYQRMSVVGNFEYEQYTDDQGMFDGYFKCTESYWQGKSLDLGNGVRRHEDRSAYIIQEGVMLYPGYDCKMANQLCYQHWGNWEHQDENGQYAECKYCKNDEPDKSVDTYDFTTNPEALVKGLTYYQALAYYNWKYQRNTMYSTDADAFLQDLVPSEEQFNKVQSGESYIMPKTDLKYPTPIFRYVVHVFEK